MTPNAAVARASTASDPSAEAAGLFARLGTLADDVLDAITRGDVAAMNSALDERDRVSARLDPLVLQIRADGVARRMAGAVLDAAVDAARHDDGGAGRTAAALWSAARAAGERQESLVREVRARREAVARELASMRGARSVSASYRAVEPAGGTRLNLVR